MSTTVEKTIKPASAVQRQSQGPFFQRKSNPLGANEAHSFFSPSFIQPKLSVSQPDDPQEKEADQMATKVMTMPEPVAATPAADKKEDVQRAAEEEPKKEEVQRVIQRKEEKEEVQAKEEKDEVQAKEEKEEVQAKEEEKEVKRKEEKEETPQVQAKEEKKEEVQRAEEKKEEVHRAAEEKEEAVQRMCKDCQEEKKTVQRQEKKDEVQTKLFDTASSDGHRSFSIHRKGEDEKEETVSRKPSSSLRTPVVMRSGRGPPSQKNNFEQSLESTKGIGTPMASETRGFMESRFNADFSGVRVHTGETSVQMNKDIHAQAFTHGNDIYFNSGKYSPHTSDGQFLLAHELTHTIQQGASSHVTTPGKSGGGNTVSTKRISRKRLIQRSAANLAAAVTNAKGEVGKVIANKKGDDGFRFGWPRLMEFFKTVFPAGKILPPGQAGDSGSVPEDAIKTIGNTKEKVQVTRDDGSTDMDFRDHMPSWCGIFAFWSLNKAGLPMKKWELGKMNIPPEAVSLTPQPGYLAYRKLRSHYGLVEKSDGSSVTTINGNTAGTDNLGGEIQVQTHPIKGNWEAFIDPLKLIEGTIRNPESGVPDKPKSLREMQKELFNVQRKEEGKLEDKNVQKKSSEQNSVLAPSVQRAGEKDKKEELQKKEEGKEEEKDKVQRKEFARDSIIKSTAIYRKSGPKIQRGIFSAIGGAISSAVEWVGDKLEEGKKWLLGKVRDLIAKVPGYKALCVALGYDPITGDTVERNGKNFIAAAMDIMPFGNLLHQKLAELGILEKAEQFVDSVFSRVDTLISGISSAFSKFYDSISLSDLKDIPGVFGRLEEAFTSFFNHVKDFAKGVAGDFLEFIKKALLIPLATFIKTQTKFWDLLCLIIGKDPLTDETRPMTGANILNAFLNLSEWGIEQKKKMQETGTFNKVAAWIDKGISIFSKSYEELKAAFTGLWDYVNIQSLMEPTETFKKIFNSFYAPIKRVADYVIETGIMILKIVKDVLIKWISDEAQKTKGYYLVTVLIGKDPFSGVKVARTTENIIKGFMLLTENGEEQFNKMKESGAMAKATAQIDAAVETLGFTWPYVKGLFTKLWDSLSWKDFIVPVKAFIKIIDTFKDPIVRLIKFVITVLVALFEVILRMMGFPVDMVFKLIDNIKKAWNSIKSNPSGFLMNVLKAIKQGFQQFFDNFLTHLVNGLIDWFFDQLKEVGVTRPPDFSLKSIINLVMQILGVSMEKIWKKLGDKIGQDKVAKIRGALDKLEGIWKFITDVQEKGIGAIWEYIQEQLSNLWTMVLDAATKWIIDKIITQVTVKLLSMLDPTGIMAVINSCIAIYKAIESFIQYFTQMLGIVNSFVEGVIEIAEGNIKKAADFLERSMARAVPIVIGFLANQVGLGKIGKKIVEVIQKIQEVVDKALDWLIDKAVALGTKMLDTLKKGAAAVLGWFGLKKPAKTKDGVNHTLLFTGSENNSVLTIQTTPMPVVDYITKVKIDNKLKDADVAIPMATAKKIETEEKKKPTEEKDKKKQMDDIEKLLEQLATELGNLPITAATGVNSGAMYGGVYSGAFGTSATVAFQKAPFVRGTSPNVNHPTYDKINARKDQGGSYYVKGHLLNDNLGGPGTTWTNLTPINRQANKDHQLNFEDKVKTIVNGTSAQVSDTNGLPTAGTMKGFSVIAQYGRGEPASLTKLKEEGDDYPPGYDLGWTKKDVIDVLEGEKSVPTALTCNATLTKKGETTDTPLSIPIQNNIEYGNLSSYQFGLRPVIKVVLADLVKDAKTENEALAALQTINGIAKARAKRIFDAFYKNKGVNNGKSEIGIGIVALDGQNPGKSLSWGKVPSSWKPTLN